MDKETYYIKLEEFIGKIKSLKEEINNSEDKEKTTYLKLALKAVHEDMRVLMEVYYK